MVWRLFESILGYLRGKIDLIGKILHLFAIYGISLPVILHQAVLPET